ncbi:phenoloxidase 1 [Anabrus simplex]|uniref:phenoloxidase 1 n=1 Tax=Anabrus simplex TaxID=316456 RepID=UPI0035A3BE6A
MYLLTDRLVCRMERVWKYGAAVGLLVFFAGNCFGQLSVNDPKAILYMMERPTESLLLPKGENSEVRFVVPPEGLSDRLKPLAEDLANRFGADTSAAPIEIPELNLPDLSLPRQLPRNEPFSTFIPFHREMASRLIEVFMGMRTYADFVTAAGLTRDLVNPSMWIFAVQVALTHRNDTRNIDVPPLSAVMPDKFLDGAVFRQAREEVTVLTPGERAPIEIPRDYTATDVEVEHRVAYFREDMGINVHHWTWHLVYPFGGPPDIVKKDRRGELFYYMHQQIIARYDFERLSNNLGRVKPFNNFQDPIEEGYFPKLDSLLASRVWPARSANAKLRDVNRAEQQLVFDIQDLERWRDRIYEAIHEGRALKSNFDYVDLNNAQGIDVLGNMLEASALSINSNLYGNLHNLGHFAISICHDPDHRHLETFGVMGDLATAMRDPTFYRWHKFVDNIFQQHKATMPPYTTQELGYDGIAVRSIEVVSQGNPRNEFNTFWQQSDVELSRGLDIAPQGAVYARLTHLQHAPFTYRIQVENSGQPRKGTVRIFMAPKFDERGLPMPFRTQRLLFIEMDRFPVDLRKGSNTIERNSRQSSITIPYERTFRRLDPTQVTPDDQEFNFCGCGWPQHMLIPKGTAAGYPAELFVMVSNFADDKVDQPPPRGCRAAESICGWFERKYPDRRPMGYPFDRNPRPGASSIRQFLLPNMQLIDVKIRFTDRTELRNAANITQTRQNSPSRPRRSL